jgi:heavy metal sensor kinase
VYNSVRFRLTVWYVAVLSLVLIGFSMGVYSLLAGNVRAEADRQLAGAIDVLFRSLGHEIEEHEGKVQGEDAFRGVIDTVYRDSFPGMGIGIYDSGRLVAAKPGPGGIVPKFAASRDENAEFWDTTVGKEPWRVALQDRSIANAGRYQFLSTASEVAVEAELADVRGIFFLSIPLALAAAALGGFLLARKSLAPVVEMSEIASRIRSKDLGQRVAVGNPKDELGKLATTFNQLLERLENSFAMQRQFMEDSSHELRTPIYVAHTAAQVTLERGERTDDEYREALGTIDQQLARLQHIVEDMFVLARADAGALPLQVAEFDLGETVTECVRAANLLGQRQQVTVRGPETLEFPCRGDEGLVRQMVLILLDNAVKYSHPGGVVQVEIDTSEPSAYSLVVRDTGIGIPEEARERIFERFYRVDKARSRASTTSRGSGAGLGLAIAKWIAGIHGGSLTLVETGPNGSTFRAIIARQALT